MGGPRCGAARCSRRARRRALLTPLSKHLPDAAARPQALRSTAGQPPIANQSASTAGLPPLPAEPAAGLPPTACRAPFPAGPRA
jgi:hypothetical protein